MGLGANLLMNPIVVVILVILLVIGVITGGLFLLFAPEIMAAVLIAIFALWLLIKGPIPNPWVRVGLPLMLLGVAILMYFYGNEVLGMIA